MEAKEQVRRKKLKSARKNISMIECFLTYFTLSIYESLEKKKENVDFAGKKI